MCLQIKSKTEKKCKIKGQIREEILPPLDPEIVSAGVRGPPVVDAHQKTCSL